MKKSLLILGLAAGSLMLGGPSQAASYSGNDHIKAWKQAPVCTESGKTLHGIKLVNGTDHKAAFQVNALTMTDPEHDRESSTVWVTLLPGERYTVRVLTPAYGSGQASVIYRHEVILDTHLRAALCW